MAITLDGNNITTGGVINSGTAQASTSGTAITFTGIPSYAKRVTVMFSGVSTSGTSNLLIQLGSGSATTSGYNAYGMNFGSGSGSGTAYTTGFGIRIASASDLNSGLMTIANITGNTWVAQGNFGNQANATGYFSAGGISLSGTLDRVIITTVNGTDTFDAGSINILYE